MHPPEVSERSTSHDTSCVDKYHESRIAASTGDESCGAERDQKSIGSGDAKKRPVTSSRRDGRDLCERNMKHDLNTRDAQAAQDSLESRCREVEDGVVSH